MIRRIAQLIPLLVAVLIVPAQAQAPDDTGTQLSLGYEYRRRIKERVRGFGDLVYKERYDPNSRWHTTGGVSYDLGKRFRIEGGLLLRATAESGQTLLRSDGVVKVSGGG